ncbi:MAG: 16S rRNA (adenine(1518)-N(6)/adenine(1519)-N(6))-dimethyltransferase RsmA [Simkaniaceae bacterium]
MERISNITVLKAFLEKEGLAANKRLSQNFLIDSNILDKIILTAQVSKGDQILEIGPGPGALTEALLMKEAEVFAIEKDQGFAKHLPRLSTNHLSVYHADFLKFDLTPIFKKAPLKVVANLPYHLTTPILEKLLPLYPSVTSLTIMVQKEVAERLTSSPRSENYGAFTLFREFYSNVISSFRVKKTSFYPSPHIDSTVLHLELKPLPNHINGKDFFDFVYKAFQKRRKMLRSSLKEYGVTLEKRPEELSLQEFIDLFRYKFNCSSLDRQT